MIKLIGLDLDGSLLTDDGKITEKNKEAIDKCISQGITVCIISGRNEESIKRYVDEFSLQEEYHIAANGAMLVNYRKGHEDLFTFSRESYETLYNEMKKSSHQFMPMNRYGYYYDDDSSGELYEVIKSWIDERSLKKADLKNIEDVYRVSILFDGKEDLKEILSLLPEELGGNTDKNVYDTRPKKVSKYAGVRKLLERYGYREDETAFIGDQASDVEILSSLKYSFCPANSEPAAKKSASVILKNTNNQSAVAEMIEEYILKNKTAE